MQKEWLKKKITVSEAEAEHILLGFQNANWRAFVAKMQNDDELWTFCSDDESWQHLFGRAGISLVRKGEIVDSFVTLMN